MPDDILKTRLPNGTSLGVGLATAGLVYGIYAHALPTIVDHRAGQPNDADAQAAERLAAWTATGVVAAVSLISKDTTVFVMGGMMVIALSWWHRHADMVNPATSSVGPSRAAAMTAQQSDQTLGAAYVSAVGG